MQQGPDEIIIRAGENRKKYQDMKTFEINISDIEMRFAYDCNSEAHVYAAEKPRRELDCY